MPQTLSASICNVLELRNQTLFNCQRAGWTSAYCPDMQKQGSGLRSFKKTKPNSNKMHFTHTHILFSNQLRPQINLNRTILTKINTAKIKELLGQETASEMLYITPTVYTATQEEH